MPLFRSAPGKSIGASISRMLAGQRGPSPLEEMQVDQAAADVNYKRSLAEQVRAKLDRDREADAQRASPDAQAQFASDVAGTDTRTGRRIYGSLRGEAEPYHPADADDAAVVGADAPSYRMAMPNVDDRVVSRVQDALATLGADRFGEGKSNAEQLMKAVGVSQENRLLSGIQEKIAKGDILGASAMNQGGKIGTPIKLFDNIGDSGATFAPATGKVNADPAADPRNALLRGTLDKAGAQVTRDRAAAGASSAHADLYRAQADEKRGKGPKAAVVAPFKDVTTLRKEFNDQKEVQAYRDIIPIVESARSSPDTRAGDIQMAYAVGKILDPASVVREGELKLVGDAATIPEKLKGQIRTLVMGKGRMTPQTRAELVAMLDSAAANREANYKATEETYRGIARQNNFPEDQVIINPPKRKELPGKPAPAVNGKGWRMHTDAAGNKAYVSPDGKQFEEVK